MFEALYQKVITDLEQGLPPWLVYHNAEHTRYVIRQAGAIATREKVRGRERMLVQLAALYHDTGFLVQKEDHERLGCIRACRELQDTPLTAAELEQICGMIRATHIPQQPNNLLEQIVADADLEYLGTAHFEAFSGNLKRELRHYTPRLTDREWDEVQLQFLLNHSYHTGYCRAVKEPVKQENLKAVKERLSGYGK